MPKLNFACSKREEAESEFLRRLFSALAAAEIEYAVMRNHETLPNSCRDTDLDILIVGSDIRFVLSTVNSAIQESRAVQLGASSVPGFSKIFVLGNNPNYGQPWWGINLDLNIGLKYKGLSLLSNAKSFPIEIHDDVSVLNSGFAGVLGVLKEVLNNGIFPERYMESARSFMEDERDSVKALLSPMGQKSLAELEDAIQEKPSKPLEASDSIRRSFFWHVASEHPFEYLSGRFFNVVSRLWRYLRPSGTVVAFLGTDGAGKSTIINAIKPTLDRATHNATVIRHLRPNFLPPLARLKGGATQPSRQVIDPHGASPSGFFGSFSRISYATINYVLGYWLDTRVQIAKQPTVVIFDRYAYDMAIDPARFRISLPEGLVRSFVRLAPKPDLVFCLVGSPQVLAARKQELPVEEVARQVDALMAFAAK